MNMKKKLYVTPSLEVVEMEFGVLLSGSIQGPIGGKDEENEEPIGTKKLEGNFNHTWE